MEVKAQAKYIRISPRKMRLVADAIRGMDAVLALDYLKFINKSAVGPITKMLNSVLANAENNFKLKREGLYIKKITVDGGPTLKRWMPRAFGRATPIRKRSAHLLMILEEKVKSIKKSKEIKAEKKVKEIKKVEEKKELKTILPEEIKKAEGGAGPKKTEAAVPGNIKGTEKGKGFVRKIFSRKTG
jgi:large subunit ribosomal protein L22